MTSDSDTNPAADEQAVDCNHATQVHPAGPTEAENEVSVQTLLLREALSNASLGDLAADLATLRVAMQDRARSAHEDGATEAVARAEAAAWSGDTRGVLTLLKHGGQFALDVAKELGVTLAAKVIGATGVGGE